MSEGNYVNGSWIANNGSSFRNLTPEEVQDAKKMAENTIPIFGGPDNAKWEEHHPVAREVWEKLGINPN